MHYKMYFVLNCHRLSLIMRRKGKKKIQVDETLPMESIIKIKHMYMKPTYRQSGATLFNVRSEIVITDLFPFKVINYSSIIFIIAICFLTLYIELHPIIIFFFLYNNVSYLQIVILRHQSIQPFFNEIQNYRHNNIINL